MMKLSLLAVALGGPWRGALFSLRPAAARHSMSD